MNDRRPGELVLLKNPPSRGEIAQCDDCQRITRELMSATQAAQPGNVRENHRVVSIIKKPGNTPTGNNRRLGDNQRMTAAPDEHQRLRCRLIGHRLVIQSVRWFDPLNVPQGIIRLRWLGSRLAQSNAPPRTDLECGKWQSRLT